MYDSPPTVKSAAGCCGKQSEDSGIRTDILNTKYLCGIGVGPAFDADSTDSIFCPHCDLVHIEEQRKRLKFVLFGTH
jgi:hypothetical protein